MSNLEIIDLEILRKKLIYRSLHRGCKENDILFEKSVSIINEMSMKEMLVYQDFLEEDDKDIYHWFTGISGPLEKYKDIINKMKGFY